MCDCSEKVWLFLLESERTVYLTDEIMDGVPEVVMAIHYLAAKSAEPIRIIIDSPGGSVFAGFAIINAIRDAQEAGVEVRAEVYGQAASMAATILQVASHRTMRKGSRLLLHEVRQEDIFKETTPSKGADEVEELRRINDVLLCIVSERSGLGIDFLREKTERREWWVGAEEALELGLIDEIR